MPTVRLGRAARWSIAIVAGTLTVMVGAAVAYAHTEVQAQPAVAGAENALITFTAEAESPTSGITSVRVVLPAGIAPSDVRLESAPNGWSMTTTTDGYAVSGTALAARVDAVHSVRVARLPNQTRLVFKVLVSYANGSVDRWIEEPTAANPNPDQPAPVLTLQPGPSPAPSSTSTGPRPTGPAPTGSAPASATGSDGETGSAIWWITGILLAVAATGAAVLMVRSRGQATP